MNDPMPSIRPPAPLWEGPTGLQSAAGSADGGDFHQYELNAFRFLLGRQPAFGFERRKATDNAFEVMIQNYAAFLFEYGKTTGSIAAHGVGVLGSPASTDKFTFRPNNVGSEQYHLGSPTSPFSYLAVAQELVAYLAIEGSLLVGDPTSPSQITSDQNNYEIGGGDVVYRLSSDASRTITGMTSNDITPITGVGLNGQSLLRIIHNVGSNNIVFADESGSSDAANRFALNGSLTLGADESVVFVYDTTSDRWRAAGVYQAAIAVPTAASQSEQEAGTEAAKYVAPATQQFHPSAAKFWLKATGNSTTIEASYNITSVADTATGRMTVTIATDFSGVDWCAQLSIQAVGATGGINLEVENAPDATSCVMRNYNNAAANTDPSAWFLAGYGDQ